MAFGLAIWTPSGYIKIDPSYSRYKIVQSGAGTAGTGVNLATPNAGVIVFTRPSTYNTWLTMQPVTTTSFMIAQIGTNGAGFSYRVLKRFSSETPVTSGFGLNLYGASGEFLYSSANPTINIDYVATCTLAAAVQNFTLPSVPFGSRFIAMTVPSFAAIVTTVSPSSFKTWDFEFCLTSETNLAIRSSLSVNATFNLGYNLSNNMYGKTVTLIGGYCY